MRKRDKEKEILGMPLGTAMNRLRKQILFNLVKECNKDTCFRCKKKIESVNELSVEHKKAWREHGKESFWDLDNISFSHEKCNYSASKRMKKRKLIHGTRHGYLRHACRCDKCKKAQAIYMKGYNERNNLRK